jgi:replication initiation and membrane attachment protein
MKLFSLLPADTYTVINRSIITEEDKNNIISLYEPLIGPIAVSLYFTLLRDIKLLDFISKDYTHHHLMNMMSSSIETIKLARQSLEGVGLLKTYYKEGDPNSYVYELFSPLSSREFFASPIFNVALYNSIGKYEYDLLKKEYSLPEINLQSYEDISVSLNEIYDTSPNILPFETRGTMTNNIKLDSNINFDLLISSLPKGLINKKYITKKIKELIEQLSFIYNLDTLKIAEILKNSLKDNGIIDEELLRKNARKYYQYNNDGKLPSLVYKSQPDSLKESVTPKDILTEKIYQFENTTPYDYLRIKNKGTNPTTSELKLLETLLVDMKLTPAVVNVLIDYVLRKNNNKLSKGYVETIASQWMRAGITTATEAIELARKENGKKPKSTSKKKDEAPSWLNKTIEKAELTKEEQEELDELLKEFR